MTTSGLVYSKSNEITMESEDLYISPKEIRVKYIFKNESASPVTSTMAFPLPKIPMHGNMKHEFVSSQPDEPIVYVENPLKFEVKVDGKKVPFKTEIKADKANYMLDVKYYWDQTFPSGKPIVIEHRYLSNPGNTYNTNIAEYCTEKWDWKPIPEKHLNYKGATITVSEHFASRLVNYVLTTGANWRGPIKKFKLTVDILNSENSVATCFDDFKKVGSTQYVSEKVDFTPRADLKIYFRDPNFYKRD